MDSAFDGSSVKADPQAQLRLLDLQAIDTVLEQLRHRRERLPELAEIASLEERLSALRNDEVRAQTDVDDLTREQQRIDRDVEQVRARAGRDQSRLESGGVPAKEVEGLQHELETLARRQTELEDTELEVMERREEIESRLTKHQADAEAVAADLDAATERRDSAFADIDGDLVQRQKTRGETAAEIPEALLNLYEKVRETSGVGAAALRQRRCEGCRIELAGVELNAVRSAAADEVIRCEECRRILVRTAESGL